MKRSLSPDSKTEEPDNKKQKINDASDTTTLAPEAPVKTETATIEVKIEAPIKTETNPVSESATTNGAPTIEAPIKTETTNEVKSEAPIKTETNPVSESAAPVTQAAPLIKKKKQKVVLYLAYSGVNYQGMQIIHTSNPGAITIESILQDVLFKVGAISESNVDKLQKIKWMRCARTDKGVHAVGQILLVDPSNPKSIVAEANALLPDDIRIFDLVYVTRSFDSKRACTARTYQYILNLEMLRPSDRHPDAANRSSWTFNEVEREKFNVILRKYIGTHNYHNFTKAMAATNASANRYITMIECSEPQETEGIKFSRVTLKGQSFVLNQIRKMIAAAACIYRDGVSVSVLEKLFSRIKVNLPIAPGLGLMLLKCHFDNYDFEKFQKESLAFTGCQAEVDKFKSEKIEPVILRMDKEQNITDEFLKNLTEYPLDYEKILNDTLLTQTPEPPAPRRGGRNAKNSGNDSE